MSFYRCLIDFEDISVGPVTMSCSSRSIRIQEIKFTYNSQVLSRWTSCFYFRGFGNTKFNTKKSMALNLYSISFVMVLGRTTSRNFWPVKLGLIDYFYLTTESVNSVNSFDRKNVNIYVYRTGFRGNIIMILICV